MANARTETQVTWSTASNITLDDNVWHLSDEMAINSSTFSILVQLDANNGSTPQTGDVVETKVLYTVGDILEDSGNDYDTKEHGQYLRLLDTFIEDPARTSVQLSIAPGNFKIAAKAPLGTSRNIVFRARIVELRAG